MPDIFLSNALKSLNYIFIIQTLITPKELDIPTWGNGPGSINGETITHRGK